MKQAERDELLIRLDVRTENIEKTTESQEKHLSGLNEKVAKNILNIDRNDKRLKGVEQVLNGGVSLKFSRKQIAGGGISIVTVIGLGIIAIGKIFGWW